MRYSFAVIGLGRVGSTLHTLLKEAGHIPQWVVTSRETEAGTPACSSIPEHPGAVEVIFITVPDGAIFSCAQELAHRWGDACRGICFFHCSGLLTSEALSPLAHLGAEVGSLHPLQSITTFDQARALLKESWFTFEGTKRCRNSASEIISSIGSALVDIAPEEKTFYHCAAVMASNYLVTLLCLANDIISRTGLDLEHLFPLVKGTLSNIEVQGRSALTGPVARGDWQTVEAHLRGLSEQFPDIVETYRALGRATARIASQQWPGSAVLHEKVLNRDTLVDTMNTMKSRGMKVVFTNGCFDIIHPGHVSYLSHARSLGDCLVVGVNADASVTRIKGPGRPINDETSRASVLAALSSVDYVMIFEEDTPYELISLVKPDVLVKGGDWKPEHIVGADIVKASGGEVHAIDFLQGYSTTSLIQKIHQG
ncbi:MAG TPA: D-glycero-beta-D-manno-heptose 1-phosphate adenylyltransferase [Deltaproteobacteria bacterium]|nr:D-glycero-beta-D-manno-heptose 1-phosphate adenylyltransferase [Deltaproteobacteria bacterium]